jgi:phosphoribosylanthranilate isomerase
MTKIKICGITNLKDAFAAIDAGADLLGFNFYPKSPRYISPETCREITAALKKDHAQVILVGVFVNMPVEQVKAVLNDCALHLAQLHGDESPEMLAALAGRVFKAIRLPAPAVGQVSASESAPVPVSPFLSVAQPVVRPALLVDAVVKGVYGGSGMVADWSAAAELSKQVPLLLAGGLTPENVGAAVRQVKPWGVDVASGVEASPGVKDFVKMKAFVQEVQRVEKEKRD